MNFLKFYVRIYCKLNNFIINEMNLFSKKKNIIIILFEVFPLKNV